MNEYPKNEELHQNEKISIFWQIQIAISLDWKKDKCILSFLFNNALIGLAGYHNG